MTTAMAAGTFDLIHKGHLYYLREAKKCGDKLVVIVARDKNILKFKGKKPKFNEAERIKHVKALKIADKVMLGHKDDIFDVISEINPDVICLGYDQNLVSIEKLKIELQARGIEAEVLRMGAFKPDVYKSSRLKSRK